MEEKKEKEGKEEKKEKEMRKKRGEKVRVLLKKNENGILLSSWGFITRLDQR